MSCDRDLTLDEALADPVIGAVLRADRVDPRQFETLLRTAASRIGADRRPAAALASGPVRAEIAPARAGDAERRFGAYGGAGFRADRFTAAPRRAAGDVCAW